jgi:hypothetical protein
MRRDRAVRKPILHADQPMACCRQQVAHRYPGSHTYSAASQPTGSGDLQRLLSVTSCRPGLLGGTAATRGRPVSWPSAVRPRPAPGRSGQLVPRDQQLLAGGLLPQPLQHPAADQHTRKLPARLGEPPSTSAWRAVPAGSCRRRAHGADPGRP